MNIDSHISDLELAMVIGGYRPYLWAVFGASDEVIEATAVQPRLYIHRLIRDWRSEAYDTSESPNHPPGTY